MLKQNLDTRRKQPNVVEKSFLKNDEIEDHEWFKTFEELLDPLSKCLFLIAVMTSEKMISLKENNCFKRLVLQQCTELKIKEIVRTFLRTKSLFALRSELRARLGLPRYKGVEIQPQPEQTSAKLNQHSDNCSPRKLPQQLATSKNWPKLSVQSPLYHPVKSILRLNHNSPSKGLKKPFWNVMSLDNSPRTLAGSNSTFVSAKTTQSV